MFRLQVIGKVVGQVSSGIGKNTNKPWAKVNLVKQVYVGRRDAEFEARFITAWFSEKAAERIVALKVEKGDFLFVEGSPKIGEPVTTNNGTITAFEIQVKDWALCGRGFADAPAEQTEPAPAPAPAPPAPKATNPWE